MFQHGQIDSPLESIQVSRVTNACLEKQENTVYGVPHKYIYN